VLIKRDILQAAVDALAPWYHSIDLGNGIITPGVCALEEQWEQNRQIRNAIDYKDKVVLDLGCADGMWAFEAEEIGARCVVGLDSGQMPKLIERFLLAKIVRCSDVIPVYGASVENLSSALSNVIKYELNGELFDIVQHLGVLYHMLEPLEGLIQTRACMKKGGRLFLETACYRNEDNEPVMIFNSGDRIYCDETTYWAPSKSCLLAMLRTSGFEPDENNISIVEQPKNIGRICLTAVAK